MKEISQELHIHYSTVSKIIKSVEIREKNEQNLHFETSYNISIEMKDVKMVLSNAISYMRFLCKDISNSDYARLNEYVNSFTMSFGLSARSNSILNGLLMRRA